MLICFPDIYTYIPQIKSDHKLVIFKMEYAEGIHRSYYQKSSRERKVLR